MNTSQAEAIAYSVTDAASKAGIGRSTLYNAISAGELLARKVGKRTVVLHADLQRWIESAPIYSNTTKTDCAANRAA